MHNLTLVIRPGCATAYKIRTSKLQPHGSSQIPKRYRWWQGSSFQLLSCLSCACFHQPPLPTGLGLSGTPGYPSLTRQNRGICRLVTLSAREHAPNPLKPWFAMLQQCWVVLKANNTSAKAANFLLEPKQTEWCQPLFRWIDVAGNYLHPHVVSSHAMFMQSIRECPHLDKAPSIEVCLHTFTTQLYLHIHLLQHCCCASILN